MFIYFLLSMFFLGATNSVAQTSREPWITVLIHGTSRPYLSMSDFIKVGTDRVENSLYEVTTNSIRNNPLLHEAQPIQGLGLQKVKLTNTPVQNSAQLFCSLYQQVYQATYPKNQVSNAYYTFGWSGLLSLSARREAADELFHELNERYAKYHARGLRPRLRIIGYSHGGNIGLYLSEIAHRKNHKPLFTVDELIMLATPIQCDTDYMMNDSLFKRIYNIYSSGDMVQPLDFISTPFQSSGRHTADDRNGFTVPDKVIQLRIKLIRKHLVLDLGNGKKRIINRIDRINPDHTEMWHFAWASQWYRKHTPLAPFPVALFVPFFCAQVETLGLTGMADITLVPEEHIAQIAQNKCFRKYVRFLSATLYNKLKNEALVFKNSLTKKDPKKILVQSRKEACECYRKQLPPEHILKHRHPVSLPIQQQSTASTRPRAVPSSPVVRVAQVNQVK